MTDAPRTPAEQRVCASIARFLRQQACHLATAILHAQDRGEDVSEWQEEQRHMIRYERMLSVRAGSPDVDYEPRPLGDPETYRS